METKIISFPNSKFQPKCQECEERLKVGEIMTKLIRKDSFGQISPDTLSFHINCWQNFLEKEVRKFPNAKITW